jgi:hypothetical protein
VRTDIESVQPGTTYDHVAVSGIEVAVSGADGLQRSACGFDEMAANP